ncbi:hypothetical protein SO802_031190 [Lithocarpus litseifolius]|uniref:Pentatricopeptide repeat-containing protein n=1 Tax=Lithocarpus litseifolius TaxID=425828 RepID=A0AAW2BN57_9ROSI
MKVDGIKPDIVCYTTAFKGAIVEGDFGKADDTFDELHGLGLVPNFFTYNVYIYGLCKQMEAVIKVIGSMEELGCKLNMITYNTLLDAFSKAGELSRTRTLVRDMGKKKIIGKNVTLGLWPGKPCSLALDLNSAFQRLF